VGTRKTDDWFPGASVIDEQKRLPLECEAIERCRNRWVSQRVKRYAEPLMEGEKVLKWPSIDSSENAYVMINSNNVCV
jgi:hypothetical protein